MKPYLPPKLHFNAHLQTIIPSVFRKVEGVTFQRERITTPDHDFLDLDWSSVYENPESLIILSHGLEGSSDRQYIKGMVKIFNNHGYDCLAWNFRSCSGQINRNLRFYHSGATEDLDLVINYALKKGYKCIYLIGFSLGGNLTLKYLGERAIKPQIKKSIVFSVPLHLASSSEKIAKPSNWLYTKRFLKSLKKKVKLKALAFPDQINLTNLGKITTVESFDEHYTSKLHGFINAKDYYAKNSSIIFVKNISIPTLIINAKNDPFLSESCYPIDDLKNHEYVKLEIPLQGGHCGFWQSGYKNFLWSELRALEFIKNEI